MQGFHDLFLLMEEPRYRFILFYFFLRNIWKGVIFFIFYFWFEFVFSD